MSAGLRYSRANHVRCLAAESLGYLFRHATDKQLRAGTRALLAEHAIRPTPAREHGAGLLIAESVLSVSHGLHSRAPSVLALLLQDGLLQPEEFAKKGSHKSAKGGVLKKLHQDTLCVNKPCCSKQHVYGISLSILLCCQYSH